MPAEKEKDKKQRVLSGRQKVAIFLVSLGMETSSEIFKHLREEEIEQITDLTLSGYINGTDVKII